MTSAAEPGLMSTPIAPGVFHDYRVTSTDLRSYDLYIDGTFVHEGSFDHGPGTPSYVAFGDFVQGAGSRHEWDYFRFGAIVPEPVPIAMAAVFLAWRWSRRR